VRCLGVIAAAALFVIGCVHPQQRVVIPIAPDALPGVVGEATSQDPDARIRAVGSFAHEPDPRAAQYLLVMLSRDVDPRVRAAAASAIADRRDPDLDGALARAADRDPDAGVRVAASAAHARLEPFTRRVGSAAGWAALCPGCGQFYLGKPAVGIAQLAAAAVFLGGGFFLAKQGQTDGSSALSLDGPVSSSRQSAGILLLGAGQNTWFYNVFDAYRDARVAQGDAGYKHKISRETLDELVLAPFTPSVVKSPYVWGLVPIALAAGIGVSFLGGVSSTHAITHVHDINFFGDSLSRAGGFAAGEGYFVGLFDPVGVGEESLFRGVIQTEMDERLGPYGGIAVASAIFGGAHALNYVGPGGDPKQAIVAVPFIATIGATLGYAYMKTGYQLKTSVAMHFWYDFLLSTVGFLVDTEHQPFVVNYSAPI
jgi:membrane protease YdiL (CAAX protease family)